MEENYEKSETNKDSVPIPGTGLKPMYPCLCRHGGYRFLRCGSGRLVHGICGLLPGQRSDGRYQRHHVFSRHSLSRLAGTPAVSGTDSYTDTQSGAWYSDAVLWASQNGVVSGYGNGLFGTNDPLTREQMATILYRYAQEKQYDVSGRNDLSAFADAARVSAYAKEAMQWAVDAGLISGIGDNLVPQNGANRAQVATMLMRFAENVNQ